jgi:hypothetical protein
METSEKTPFVNHRDALLEMYEVGESINAFGYALRLCLSLRHKTITMEQFDSLVNEFQWYCQEFNIQTSNEIASLF